MILILKDIVIDLYLCVYYMRYVFTVVQQIYLDIKAAYLYIYILFCSFRSSSKWRITLRRTTLASGWKCSNQSSLSQCHAGQHHHCHDFSDYSLCLVSALSFVDHDNCKTSSQNIGAVVNTYSSRDLTLPSISCMTPTCINLLDTTHSSNVINIVLLGDIDLVGNKLHVKSTNLRHSTYNHICIYYNILYVYVTYSTNDA